MTNVDFGYSAGDVAKILNWHSAQVAKLGQIIKPSEEPIGRGHRAGYSFRNIVEIRIADELIRFGVPQKRIAYYLRSLSRSKAEFDWLANSSDGMWAALDGTRQWAVGMTLDGVLSSLNHVRQVDAAIFINLGSIKEMIHLGIQNLQRKENF